MKILFRFLTSKWLGTTTNSWLQFTANRPSAEFLPTLEVSFQGHINTTCCPKSFNDFCIKKYFGKDFVKKKVVLKALEKKLVCVLPFLGKKSMQLRTRLVNSIESNLKICKLEVIFQSPCKLNSLFRYKDSLQKKIRSDTIYRYMCSNCKVTYARLLIMVKHTATFLLELQSIWVFLI